MTCQEQSDEALVALTLAGDLQAYEKLVLRHQRNVIASAYSIVRDHFMAEDAAQDAFVAAWRKLDLLRRPSKYGSWVCRISANRARNMLACHREYMDIEQIENIGISGESDMAEGMIAREEQETLRSMMENLPERTRLAVSLYYFEGMLIKDIAERMLVSSGTVKWQLHQGRMRLRKELACMNDNGISALHNKSEREGTALLASRIMESIKEIQLWRLRDNRDGFQERYQDSLEEILADLDSLPESGQKHRILADILREIWDWMPEKQNDALWDRIREAAVKGRNKRDMEAIMRREAIGLFGEEKVSFVLGVHIPFLEEHGFVQSLGRGYCEMSDREKSFSAYGKALSILEPKNVYYAFAMAARQMEKIYFDPKKDLILENIDREVQGHMHRTDYKYFDNPEFYDVYAVAYGFYAQKASNTFWTCSTVLARIMAISALVAYVLSSTGYIVAIALLSVVVRVLISKAVSRINVETDERLAPMNRFKDYLHQAMCSRESAMDSKCTGIFEILMGRYHDATREAVVIRRRYGMRQAALSSIEALVENGLTGAMRLIVCSMVLSGGERQKLSIARLMVGEFGLLIYDEPTAALDPIAEANLNFIIFAEDNRATTVLISHRLTNVVNADYIYVMKEGWIAEEGTHASLMEKQGYYHEMFTLQAKKYSRFRRRDRRLCRFSPRFKQLLIPILRRIGYNGTMEPAADASPAAHP